MRLFLAAGALALAACSPPPAAPVPPAGDVASGPAAAAPAHVGTPAPAPAGRDPAILLFERRVADDARDGLSRAILAHLYLRAWELRGDAADLDRAADAARGALEREPRHAQAVAHLAHALTGLRRFDEALEVCRTAIDANGPNVFVLEARGDAAFEAGRWKEADAYADVLLSRSTDAPAVLLQARLAEIHGDAARGATLARDAAAAAQSGGMLPHEIARCHVTAGRLAMSLGRFEDAEADFRRALERCPQHAGALGGLADLARLQGRAEDADRLAQEAAAERPAPHELFRAGEDARAVALCEARPEVWGRELARHLVRVDGGAERALSLLDADLARGPQPEAHVLRARALLALGRTGEAAAALEAAAATGWTSPRLLVARARVAAARGDRAAARAALEQVRSLADGFVPADLRTLLETER